MKSGIYCIKNLITNKLYIGKAFYTRKRINTHKWLLRHNKHVNVHLQRAWNKYGESNFTFDIIEYCNIESLPTREDYWTKFYKSNDMEYGYNLMIPGRQNYTHSDETKQKMRARKLGKKMSEEHRNNNTLSKYKPILQFTKSGEFVKEWLGASYVRDVLGYVQTNITEVCNGKRKTAHGYVWKYKN
jgi:group I intron endonuclease